MGPTNQALLTLFQADTELRAAQERLDAATRGIRIQRRRVTSLKEQLDAAKESAMHARASADALQLDVDTRNAHIEHLREQQQSAGDNKQYQALLVDINNHKADRERVETETLTAMETAETRKAEAEQLETSLATEQEKLAELEATNEQTVATLTKEVADLEPARSEAEANVKPAHLELFEKLSERYDGESLAPIEMPDARRMEYFCGSCNSEMPIDIYNRVHSRDEITPCPMCSRILFIPAALTPDQAVPKKAKKSPAARKKAAAKKAPSSNALKKLLSTASAESLREAEVRGADTITCEVSVDGKAAGEFLAVSREDLVQRVQAKMQHEEIEGKLIITSREAETETMQPAASAD
ncbi:MAG: hypothetical protein AAF656_09695 [Planctomycetota bacterium]